MGASPCGRVALADHVVDALLPGFHARQIVGEADRFLLPGPGGAGKAQQRQDALPVARVFAQALLEDAAELLPETGVFAGVLARQFRQQLQRAACERVAHRLDLLVLLQQFARDIQRQVAGIDDSLDEAQVQGQELLSVVHDEHAPYVELEPPRGVALPQVERGLRRHVQEAGVLALALDAIVAPDQRVGPVMADVAVEGAVVLIADLGARPRPQGLCLVDGLVLEIRPLLDHADREGDVIRVTPHQRAQAPGVGKFARVRLQVQDHGGAAWRTFHRFHGEFPVGAGLPADTLCRRQVRAAAVDLDPLGDDERRIETDAKLADQLGVALLVAGQAAEEFGGAGLGDGAQMGDRFLAAHPHAIVAHAERAGRGVEVDPDGEFRLIGQQLRGTEGQEAQPVVGIGGIGNQLAQEDLPVAVEGMDHQLQELAHFGLEAVRLARVGHRKNALVSGQAGERCVLWGRTALKSSQGAQHVAGGAEPVIHLVPEQQEYFHGRFPIRLGAS